MMQDDCCLAFLRFSAKMSWEYGVLRVSMSVLRVMALVTPVPG